MTLDTRNADAKALGMFFDTHTHLANKQFDHDLPAVLARARTAGITRMVAPATDLENARKLLAIAEQEPDVRVAVGIHPCDADSVSGGAFIGELREVFQHSAVLRRQIDFGQRHGLPNQRRVKNSRSVEVLRIERHAARIAKSERGFDPRSFRRA